MQPHLFCFGLGYSAARLGRRLMADGWRVSGTTRSDARAARLRDVGFTVHHFSGDHPLAELKAAMDVRTNCSHLHPARTGRQL